MEHAVSWWWRPGIGVLAVGFLIGCVVLAPLHPALAETTLLTPITFPTKPFDVAVNPTTNRIYISGVGSNTLDDAVTVIDGATNAVVGTPIDVGTGFVQGIAVNPATNRVYVATFFDGTVTVIDGATNAIIGTPIALGQGLRFVAVNPVTNRVYVTTNGTGTVTVIDGAAAGNGGAGAVLGMPIAVGRGPDGIAVNPATNRVYVANFDSGTVSVIDGATNTVVGSPITVGTKPEGVGVNPLTNRIYVANSIDSTVSVINGATNKVIGQGIPVGLQPFGVTVNPATNRIYVPSAVDGSVAVIDGATNTVVDTVARVGSQPILVDVNPVTGRAYVVNFQTSVAVIGIPFNVSPNLVSPGSTLVVNWGNLAGANGADFIGLYQSAAPNDLPLSRIFTNGTTTAGGPGVPSNTLELPIPPGLAAGGYEVRLVSGTSGGALSRVSIATPAAKNDAYTIGVGGTLTVPAPGLLANDTTAGPSSLQALAGTNPAHGTLDLHADGSFVYTPTAGFSGADSFTYRVIEKVDALAGKVGLPATATVSIAVGTATPTPTPTPTPTSDCAPRPPVKVTAAVGGGKLTAHVQSSPLNSQQPNPLKSLRFGTLQNARVSVTGQPIASGQTFTVPAGSSTLDFAVERAAPGQATTVPFTVTDGCGDWQTFVGGGPGVGF